MKKIKNKFKRKTVFYNRIIICLDNLKNIINKYNIDSPIHNGGLNYTKQEKTEMAKDLTELFNSVIYLEFLNNKTKNAHKNDESFEENLTDKEIEELKRIFLEESKQFNNEAYFNYRVAYNLILNKLEGLLYEE